MRFHEVAIRSRWAPIWCIVFTLASGQRASAQSPCVASSDPGVAAVQSYIQRLVTAPSGSGLDSTRVRYHLPEVADTEVTVVSDTAVCTAAAAAYAVERPSPDTVAVAVIRVGASRYVVWDTGHTPAGEFEIFFVFDSAFTRLTAFAG